MSRMMMYVLAGMLLTGCGGSRNGPFINAAGKPDFVQNPPQECGALYGTGIAELQCVQLAKETADLRARREIVSVLGMKVTAALRNCLGQAGIGSKAEIRDLAQSITRALSDAKLTGLSIEKRELFKGKIYSLAKYPLDDSMKKLVSEAVSKELSARKALFGQFRDKQGFERLEKQLDKLKASE